MAVSVDVGADGAATRASVPRPKGTEPERCALDVLGRLRLPAAPTPGTVLLGIEAGTAAGGTPAVRFGSGPMKLDPAVMAALSGDGTGIGGIVGMSGVQLGVGLPKPATGPSLTLGEVTIEGALDRAAVEGEVRRNLARLQYCYQQELTRHPTLAGEIVERFVIADDGSVATAEATSSTLQSRAVARCVDERFRAMRFPAPTDEGTVEVTWPLTFQPG